MKRFLFIFTILFVGICHGQTPYNPKPKLNGELVFARAESMQTLLEAWAVGFNKVHPNAKITLRQNTKLSAEAFDELLEGTVQAAPFVREMFPSEVRRFRQMMLCSSRLPRAVTQPKAELTLLRFMSMPIIRSNN
jgi:hypothetical protein